MCLCEQYWSEKSDIRVCMRGADISLCVILGSNTSAIVVTCPVRELSEG